MKTAAIIPAGGSGKRLGAPKAKQYLMLRGKPLLVYALSVFERSDVVDEIILVVPQEDVLFVQKSIVNAYGFRKISHVIAGGAQRQDSVGHGLGAITEPCDLIIVSDGVRPFVTEEMISRVVEAARRRGAAVAGVMAKDTIKQTRQENLVAETLPRQRIWQAQTPQAFRYDLFCKAFEAATQEGYTGTDDASLLERIGADVEMVAGSYENIKITTPEDLVWAEAFLGDRMTEQKSAKVGMGYDSHRFAPDRKLILGGVDIPFERGLAGHSDADALTHAVCDALLGMAGSGDIGRHFPDTDPAYKNISSLVLLERVRDIISDRGVSVNQIDVTVILERPKIAPHAANMAEKIARALNIAASAVNIKAKTNEGMGFIGREEGIAVMAVASGIERIPHDR